MSKVALVTGASSGMGAEFARQLAMKGYELLLVSNQAEALEKVAGEIRDLSAALEMTKGEGVEMTKGEGVEMTVHTLCIDLAQHGAAERVMEWCDSLNLTLDVLVNDAGMFFMEYLTPENLPKARSMIALHVETVTDLCVLAAARMKGPGAHILNVSSMTAEIPAPGIAVYSATKAYLKSFGKSLGYELRPFGITVTTVCPAAVDTGLYPLKPSQRKTLKRLGIIRTPQWLVRKSLKAMFRGRRVISPGLLNALVPAIVRLMPNRLKDRLGMKWIYGKV